MKLFWKQAGRLGAQEQAFDPYLALAAFRGDNQEAQPIDPSLESPKILFAADHIVT